MLKSLMYSQGASGKINTQQWLPNICTTMCRAGDKEAPGLSTDLEHKVQPAPRPVVNGAPPRPPGLEEPSKGGIPRLE